MDRRKEGDREVDVGWISQTKLHLTAVAVFIVWQADLSPQEDRSVVCRVTWCTDGVCAFGLRLCSRTRGKLLWKLSSCFYFRSFLPFSLLCPFSFNSVFRSFLFFPFYFGSAVSVSHSRSVVVSWLGQPYASPFSAISSSVGFPRPCFQPYFIPFASRFVLFLLSHSFFSFLSLSHISLSVFFIFYKSPFVLFYPLLYPFKKNLFWIPKTCTPFPMTR